MAGFDPDAYLAQPAPPDKKKSEGFDPDAYLAGGKSAPAWGDALMAAPGAALGELGDAASWVGRQIADAPQHPLGYKIAKTLAATPAAMGHELGGILQYIRNLSPQEFRGSAPEMAGGEPEAHPWLALTQGDTAPMRQAVATKPLGVAADVAAVLAASPEGRALLGRGADLAMAGPKVLVRSIGDMAPATRAENTLLRSAGTNPEGVAGALETNASPVPGVGYSAAQATQNPDIIALEKLSRMRRAPDWAMFDAGQNTGMFNALHNVVSPYTDDALNAAREARDAATKYERKGALALADQGSLEHPAGFPAGDVFADRGIEPRGHPEQFSGPIRTAAQWELAGDSGGLPSVQKTANFVLSSLPEEGATAGRAYATRKQLADALNARAGVPLSELGGAVKEAGVTARVLKSTIDRSLDEASGGMWKKYLDAFATNSKDVNSVEALNNIRAELQEKIAGGAVDLNGNPRLSRAYINQIIERHATNKYGDLIAPEIKAKLDAIRTTAQRLEAPQANYRMAATGGGGSDTVPNLLLTAGAHAAGHGALVRALTSVARGVGSIGEEGGATRLAGLLQNPVDAANAIRNAAAREAARKMKSTGVKPAALAAAMEAARNQPQE